EAGRLRGDGSHRIPHLRSPAPETIGDARLSTGGPGVVSGDPAGARGRPLAVHDLLAGGSGAAHPGPPGTTAPPESRARGNGCSMAMRRPRHETRPSANETRPSGSGSLPSASGTRSDGRALPPRPKLPGYARCLSAPDLI